MSSIFLALPANPRNYMSGKGLAKRERDESPDVIETDGFSAGRNRWVTLTETCVLICWKAGGNCSGWMQQISSKGWIASARPKSALPEHSRIHFFDWEIKRRQLSRSPLQATGRRRRYFQPERWCQRGHPAHRSDRRQNIELWPDPSYRRCQTRFPRDR